MALHEILWPNLALAYDSAIHDIHGKSLSLTGPTYAQDAGGSLNYLLMRLNTLYLAGHIDTWIRQQLIVIYTSFLNSGHLYLLGGAEGARYECGAPSEHWSFNVGSIAAGAMKAQRDADTEILDLANRVIRQELGLDLTYQYKGVTAFPCSRVKDEKNQAPMDGYRNDFVTLMTTGKLRRGTRYFAQPQAFAIRVCMDLVRLGANNFSRTPINPKLILPINSLDIPGGGYVAWIDKSDLAVQLLGKDCCHWVRNSASGLKFGYDWSPYPGPEAITF